MCFREDHDSVKIHCGTAVIINNISYKDGDRVGTKEDENNLKATFENLGLEVIIHQDVSTIELLLKLQTVAEMDHTTKDCFVCAILSHGGQYVLTQGGEQRMCDIIQCNDGIISAGDLWNCFTDDKAPTLKNKPRLFFIQACRGLGCPATVQLTGDGQSPKIMTSEKWEEEEKKLNYGFPAHLPVYPEIMLAWATVPGYYSFRDKKGSPFIEYLCKGLHMYREDDLLTILTWVQNQVAIKYAALLEQGDNLVNFKQMPWVASMLTKNVYFRNAQT
ncbi:Caspase-7 [Lamellibrachia satsuma]|nr:Caspase-7 [Lamellibrachia satsuma]